MMFDPSLKRSAVSFGINKHIQYIKTLFYGGEKWADVNIWLSVVGALEVSKDKLLTPSW